MDEEPKKAKPKPIQVRVLKSTTTASLVEWELKGKLSRATVQAADVVDGCVDAMALEAGIPYGLPWEEIAFQNPTPEQLAGALRRAGIWTENDLHTKPQAAIGALQSVYNLHLSALVAFAKRAGQSGKE